MRGVRAALVAGGVVAALVLGASGGAEAAVAAPKVSFSLSITYPADLQRLAGSARFHGTASGLPTGTTVQVQRRVVDGSWRTLATVKTAAHGAYTGGFTPSGVGRETFRARVPAKGKRAATASALRTMTVSKFFNLDDLPLARPADGVTLGPFSATAGGTVVPHAIVMDGVAAKSDTVIATWELGGHCSKVFSEVGSAADQPGFVASASIGEGKTLFSESPVTSGGFAIIQTPVRDAKTLSLVASISKPGTGGEKVVWIFPSVLCSVDPRSL